MRWAALLLALFSCFFTAVAYAMDKGELYIVTEDYPPYEMVKTVNGQRGFDFDVVHLIFETLNYTPEVEFLPWKRALLAAQQGTTVGIITCAYRKERAEFILYSDPISEFTNGFYTRSDFDGPVPKMLEDVRGFKSASIASYESLKALQDLGLNPFLAQNVTSALRMLNVHRFDYLYLNKQAADYQIRNLGLSGKFKFHPIETKEFYFCFSKKYPEVEKIAKEFARALAEIKANGTYDKIHANYK